MVKHNHLRCTTFLTFTSTFFLLLLSSTVSAIPKQTPIAIAPNGQSAMDVHMSGTQVISASGGSETGSLAVDHSVTADSVPASLQTPASSISVFVPPTTQSSLPTPLVIGTTTNSLTSSTSTSSSSNNSTAPETTHLIKIAIPAVIGGLALLTLLTYLVFFLLSKKRNSQLDEKDSLKMRQLQSPELLLEKGPKITSYADSDQSYVPYNPDGKRGSDNTIILPPSPNQLHIGTFAGKSIGRPKLSNGQSRNPLHRLSERFSGRFSFTSRSGTPNNNGYFEFDSRKNDIPDVPSVPIVISQGSNPVTRHAEVSTLAVPMSSLNPPFHLSRSTSSATQKLLNDPFAAPTAPLLVVGSKKVEDDKHLSSLSFATESDFDDGRSTMYGGRRGNSVLTFNDANSTNGGNGGLKPLSYIGTRKNSVSSSRMSLSPVYRNKTLQHGNEPLSEADEGLRVPGNPHAELRDSTISIYQTYGHQESMLESTQSHQNTIILTRISASSAGSIYSMGDGMLSRAPSSYNGDLDMEESIDDQELESPRQRSRVDSPRDPRSHQKSASRSSDNRSGSSMSSRLMETVNNRPESNESIRWIANSVDFENEAPKSSLTPSVSTSSKHKRMESFGYAL